MPKETVPLTEIEVDLLGVFVKRTILQDTKVIAILTDLIKKLEK